MRLILLIENKRREMNQSEGPAIEILWDGLFKISGLIDLRTYSLLKEAELTCALEGHEEAYRIIASKSGVSSKPSRRSGTQLSARRDILVVVVDASRAGRTDADLWKKK